MADFRILKAFNATDLRAYAGAKARIGRHALPHFSGDSMPERVVRALARARALPIKEVAEAFEFFAIVRRHLRRAPCLADLCCGHGLAGLLFAIFERQTEEVVLWDKRRPPNFEPVLDACTEVAPWIQSKVRYVEAPLERIVGSLPAGTATLSVHACGKLTDRALEVGVRLGGPLAAMPCCRDHTHSAAPPGLREALGEDVAYDVARTYRLEEQGYQVRWREIAEEITPMNRVLIGVPRTGTGAAASGRLKALKEQR